MCCVLHCAPHQRPSRIPSDCVFALVAIASRPRLTGGIFESGLFPQFQHPRDQVLAHQRGCARHVRCVLTVMARSHARRPQRPRARARAAVVGGRTAGTRAGTRRCSVALCADRGTSVSAWDHPRNAAGRGRARLGCAWAMALAHQIQECSGAGAAMQRSQNQKWPFPAVSRWPCASDGAQRNTLYHTVKIYRETAFWALKSSKISRCAPNHGGRAAGASTLHRRTERELSGLFLISHMAYLSATLFGILTPQVCK